MKLVVSHLVLATELLRLVMYEYDLHYAGVKCFVIHACLPSLIRPTPYLSAPCDSDVQSSLAVQCQMLPSESRRSINSGQLHAWPNSRILSN